MTDTEYETIRWSFDGSTGIGRITLDRPEKLNAIDTRMQREIVSGVREFEAIDEAADGVSVRALLLRGAGDDAFSSGLDVGEMSDVSDYDEKRRIPARFHEMTDTIEAYGAPVVAAVDGLCLGGGLEVALACDFIFASERSRFGQPEVNFGLLPGGGGAQRLSMIVGVSRAKEMCMTGEQIDAARARAEGIVDHVYPAEELPEAVREFVERLSEKPPLAVRTIKQAANRTQEGGYQQAIEFGKHAWPSLAQTRDYQRAVDSFGTDATPEWEGR